MQNVNVTIMHMHTAFIGNATHNFNFDNFRHPKLNTDEMHQGTRLGIDTWADTCCSGKHAYVESFIEGRSVTANGFSPSLGNLENLRIANVLYAYDMNDGNTILLENNNTIYMGHNMTDSLLNPIQCEDNDVHIDVRPQKFYPKITDEVQRITFDDGFSIPILYNGVLPYIPVRRPTSIEIHTITDRRQLTSTFDWNPQEFDELITPVTTNINFVTHDFINDDLNCQFLSTMLSFTPTLVSTSEDDYATVMAINFKKKKSITPEQLSKLWHIGIKTAERTLKATTYKIIRTTGLLTKRFRTDKAQLRYNQLGRTYGTFYTDYLKNNVKSVRGYIGGTIYTNKLGFKKFFPHSDETGASTASGLRNFIDMVGLPYAIHSDGHNNFIAGAFKKLLRKFGIPNTSTEPHSPWQNRAEYAIQELKQYARKIMIATDTPIRLWCYCY